MAVGSAPALILQAAWLEFKSSRKQRYDNRSSRGEFTSGCCAYFKVGTGTGDGMSSSLKAGWGGVGGHNLPTCGLQHGNNDSKFNEGGIINVGTGPIPSNTMALQ